MKFNTFFLIQKFESKPLLSDSAGYLEIARPFIESGYAGKWEIYEFGKELSHYEELIIQQVNRIKNLISDLPVVIYGAGEHTACFLKHFKRLNIIGLSDSETSLWHKTRYGFNVYPPEEIPSHCSNLLISSRVHESAIATQLSLNSKHNFSLHLLYEGLQDTERKWRETHQQQALDRILKFNTELLFYTPSSPSESVPASWFHEIKKQLPDIKIVVPWWDYDESSPDNAFLGFERDSLKYADLILEMSNQSRIDRIINNIEPYQDHRNGEKIIFLPSKPDSKIFKYRKISKDIDIAIFGSPAGRRRHYIESLSNHFGEKFHHIGGVYSQKPVLPISDYAELLNRSKIVINTQTYPSRTQCKGKVRETFSSGTFLLEEDNPETRELLHDTSCIVYFSGDNDLIQKIEYFLSNEAEREQIAKQGHDWINQNLSEKKWAQTIINKLYSVHKMD